jgi:hypothetical protein
MSVAAPTRAARSAPLAAFLSFLWPGLGEWYAGYPRRAVAFALPVVIAVALLATQLAQGFLETAVRLFSPSFALFVLSRWSALASCEPSRSPSPPASRARPRR